MLMFVLRLSLAFSLCVSPSRPPLPHGTLYAPRLYTYDIHQYGYMTVWFAMFLVERRYRLDARDGRMKDERRPVARGDREL